MDIKLCLCTPMYGGMCTAGYTSSVLDLQRVCKELNIKTVAIYSKCDKDSYHVFLADEAYRVGFDITEHTGCKDLLDATLRIAPKLHIFGHIHYSGQQQYIGPKTTYANVSMLNEAYLVWGKPMVFDVDHEGIVSIV